jgi:glycosyltransferase involved in cell wall biosynthesis
LPFFLVFARSYSEVDILARPFLSIIIPAHNEAQRLPPSLQKIDSFLKRQPYTSEVLVVENGSSDGTLSIAQSFTGGMPNLRIFSEDARGKGLAVKRGMLEARGDYRFLCDADLSMPIEQVNRFLPPNTPSCDVAIGSREVPGAQRFEEPAYRHLIGRIFNTMVRWLVLPGLQDTQCGFKCFTAEVAGAVFPLQTLQGMSFDAEVLFIARKMGFRIQEIPIDWFFNPDSRVRLVGDSLRMGFDLLTIRWNALRGRYDA